jgi:hypothetical protein
VQEQSQKAKKSSKKYIRLKEELKTKGVREMLNIKEIAAELDNILEAATNFINSLKNIKDNIASDGTKPEEQKSVEAPAQKKEITLAEVRTVLAELSRNDHTKEVKDLLRKYGAEKLSLINPKHYEALLNDAKEIQ